MDDACYQHCSKYILKSAPFLFLILDEDGNIKQMNQYAQTLIGKNQDKPLSRIIVDFHNKDFNQQIIHLAKDNQQESIFNVITDTGEPRSFLFTFSTLPEGILVLGKVDQLENEFLSNELYSLNQELSNLGRELHKKNASLEDALAHIKTLQGILPICMHCHKIRNDKQIWNRLEVYIENHTQAEFSHSICETCLDKFYPEHDDSQSEEPSDFDSPDFSKSKS